ncbi:MAG TPA: hypothetical protein VGH14_12640 [Solirubrobacterales bacterium]|jgi:DNA-binding MarR family transcriptional regulator
MPSPPQGPAATTTGCWRLEDLGPANQANLGRSTELDRSDVVATLTELEADALLKKLDDIVADVQEELLAPLSAAERAELVRLLGRVAGRSGGRT